MNNKSLKTRIITKFAWLPVTAYNPEVYYPKETRWLCTVKIHQTYNKSCGWIDNYFIDD